MRTPNASPEHVLCVSMRGLLPVLAVALERTRDDHDVRPAVVLSRNDASARALVVSSLAVRHGVRVGMSRGEAKRRCPALRFVTGGRCAAGVVARALTEQLATFSPAVEPDGDDRLVIRLRDARLTGAHGVTTAQRVAQWLLARVGGRFGRRPRIGIGPNVLVARVAARMADGGGVLVLDTARYREAVGDWRVRELPGVDERVERRLWDRGILTIGQLMFADEASLGLGVAGRVLCRRARGEEPRTPVELAPVALPAPPAASRVRVPREVRPVIERDTADAIEQLVTGVFGARVRARLRRDGRAGEWRVLPLEALRRSA